MPGNGSGGRRRGRHLLRQLLREARRQIRLPGRDEAHSGVERVVYACAGPPGVALYEVGQVSQAAHGGREKEVTLGRHQVLRGLTHRQYRTKRP